MSGQELLQKCVDAVDRILYKAGLEFDDEAETWEDFVEELRKLIERFYEDLAGEGSYRPSDASDTPSSSSESDEGESESEAEEAEPEEVEAEEAAAELELKRQKC